MTNNLVLSLLALILAVLAALFPFRREDQPPAELPQRIREIRFGVFLTAIVLSLFAVAVTVWPAVFGGGSSSEPGLGGSWIAVALAIGALVSACSSAAPEGASGFAMGMAVFGASLVRLLPASSIASAQIAFIAGTFIAAFATGGIGGKLSGGYLCSLSAVFIVSADFLGRSSLGSDPASTSGEALGFAFLIAAIVSGVAGRFSKSGLVRGGLGFVTLLLVGYIGCWKYLGSDELAMLWIGGVVVGGIVHLLLLGEERAEPFRFVLATVIWLGAATVAFGLNKDGRGYGMAICLLGGASLLVLLGNTRGLMTLCVAASVLIYRLFRELQPEEAKAPDIGQHYTMIGITIGALLPLLPLEWGRSRTIAGWRAALAGTIWLLILIGLPIAASVLLGSKGAVGLVVGLSLAALVEGLRGTVTLAPVGLAAGIGSLTVLTYGWLGDWTDLERAVKVRAVIFVAAAMLVLSGALFGISRRETAGEA